MTRFHDFGLLKFNHGLAENQALKEKEMNDLAFKNPSFLGELGLLLLRGEFYSEDASIGLQVLFEL